MGADAPQEEDLSRKYAFVEVISGKHTGVVGEIVGTRKIKGQVIYTLEHSDFEPSTCCETFNRNELELIITINEYIIYFPTNI